ncbi:MAG: DHHW family protein [[Eubacterium] saphenum]|nr:DHHW family protein [[Eubacterium] saphenum]
MRNKVISILFCVLLAAGIGASAILPDKYYSESEKRTLKQFPSLTAEEIFDGKLGDEIEQYLAEQFPARDGWVTVKTLAELASGKREIGGVFFADDGYLIEAHKSLPSKQAKTNIAALKMLSDSLAKSNIEMRVILAPTASQILSEKLPPFAPNANQSAVIEYARKQGMNVVDVTGALSGHKDEYIFYKTDHHWTSLGAYYAYAEWRRAKGETPEPIDAWTKRELCDNFRGTTYSKVNFPFAPFDTIDAYFKRERHEVNYNNGEYVTDSIFEEKFLNGSDQYAVFFNSNQAVTKINGSGSGKILIIKDSYANCFRQFVVDDYAETHLIDLRFFTGKVTDYIRENGIAEVLVLYNIQNFSTDISAARCFR